MRKLFTAVILFALMSGAALANLPQDLELEAYPWYPHKVHVTSKLQMEPLFVGGVDLVQTTALPAPYGADGNGAAPTAVPAKQWHDFIGFTPADPTQGESGLGWVTVNHELMNSTSTPENTDGENWSTDDNIGDGGGMTSFLIDVDQDGKIVVVPQTLEDGRSGEFFNIDFVNTVGTTGMNCGGINSQIDGRIWTAEEWQRRESNVYDRDNGDFTIGSGTSVIPVSEGFPGYDGVTIPKWQNYNYMVEVDPRQAKAVRKQYNWGRNWFEGGTVLSDNRTVILGVDASPAFLYKFVADEAGDFTSGTLYAFKQDAMSHSGTWVEVNSGANIEDDSFLNVNDQAAALGCALFIRIEWVTYDRNTGNVYMTETGRDSGSSGPGILFSAFRDETNAVPAYHHWANAALYGKADPYDVTYQDYYGRVLCLTNADQMTSSIDTYVNGGPIYPDFGNAMEVDTYTAEATYVNEDGEQVTEEVDIVTNIDNDDGEWTKEDYVPYPAKHLTNPDGISIMYHEGKSYLLIQEDLNGVSHGRVHPGLVNRNCEFWIVEIEGDGLKAEVNDLVRLGVVALGAEVTGARPVYDQSGALVSVLVNSQHPKTFNEGVYKNSLTVSITGWNEALSSIMEDGGILDPAGNFSVYPNPTATEINFDTEKLGGPQDAAIYDLNGQRVRVVRNATRMFVGDLPQGTYFLKFDGDDNLQQVVISR